jgi:hypothetical protein
MWVMLPKFRWYVLLKAAFVSVLYTEYYQTFSEFILLLIFKLNFVKFVIIDLRYLHFE